MTMELLTEGQAFALVEELNEKFGCRPCKVQITKDLPFGRSCYFPHTRTIALRQKDALEWIILHEFAHHLVAERERLKKVLRQERRLVKILEQSLRRWYFSETKDFYAAPKTQGKRPKRRRHHGDEFVRALYKVISARNMQHEYPLEREYKTVAKKLRTLIDKQQ